MRSSSASPAVVLTSIALSLTMFSAACSSDSAERDRSTTTTAAAAASPTSVQTSSTTTATLPIATADLVAGEPALLSLGTHCGVTVLDRLINGRVWRASEGAGKLDWLPPEWSVDESLPDGPVVVEALLAANGESITVSKDGRSVVYLPGGRDFEVRDLCD